MVKFLSEVSTSAPVTEVASKASSKANDLVLENKALLTATLIVAGFALVAWAVVKIVKKKTKRGFRG